MPRLTRTLLMGVLTLSMLLGDGGRTFADSAKATADTEAVAATIHYRVERAGYASLGVYDANGLLLRSLLAGKPVKPGEHTVPWDGLDRWGRPAAPGEYEWRMVVTPGFKATYQLTLGTNPAGDPWQVWVGNHTGVTAVAVDGADMYVGAGVSENVPSFLKQSLDGSQHHWRHKRFDAWVGPIAIAVVGEQVFFLQLDGKIQIVGKDIDEEKGRYEGHIPSSPRLGTWDLLWPGDKVAKPLWPGYADLMDMDGWDDSLAVVWREHDAIRWLDPATGETQAETTVAAPQAVALAPQGVAYVISEGRVLRILRGNGETPVEIIPAARLTAPRHLAVDRTAGELLVAEADPGHQVKRFRLDGEPLTTYGRPGGRAYGHYVSRDFFQVTAIAADEQGGFLLSEHGLGRTVHVGGDGEVINAWYGPQSFFNFATPDPADPTRAFYQVFGGDKALAKMDFDNRSWKVLAVYQHHTFDGLFPRGAHYTIRWQARRRGGELYLVTGGTEGVAIVRVDEAAGKLVPVARIGAVNRNQPPAIWSQVLEHHGERDPEKAPVHFAWSDLNGDGAFQPEEFALGGAQWSRMIAYVDDDWNVVFGNANPKAHGGTAWFTLSNQAKGRAAAPRWNLASIEPGPGNLPKAFSRLGQIDTRDLHVDEQGGVYLLVSGNRHWETSDRHGEAWPTSRAGSSRVVKWKTDGTLEWVSGRHGLRGAHHVAPPIPGDWINDPTRFLGIVNETIVYGDRVRNPAAAFTTDGLFAGTFLDRRADDGLPSHLYAWWRDAETRHPDTVIPYDNLTAGSIRRIDDDTVLWMPMGEMNTPVYQVSGWADWHRAQGKLRLEQTPAHARRQGTGLAAEYFANLELADEPVLTRTDPRVWFEQAARPQAAAQPFPDQLEPTEFSARWRGQLEGHLSEDYVFSVYTQDRDRVRLWLDDELILEYWPTDLAARDPRPQVTWEKRRETVSRSRAMKAGHEYGLRLEYASATGNPLLSLNWDSFTQERQRLPGELLYPPATDEAEATQQQ